MLMATDVEAEIINQFKYDKKKIIILFYIINYIL